MEAFMRLSIGNKLALGFGALLAIMLLVGGMSIVRMFALQAMNLELSKRSADEAFTTKSSRLANYLGGTEASGIINRHIQATEEEWARVKEESRVEMGHVAEIVDTEKEKALFKDATTAYQSYVTEFETVTLPLLRTKNPDQALLEKSDAAMDVYGNLMSKNMDAIEASIAQEQGKTESAFAASIRGTVVILVILLALGFIAGLLLAIYLALSISRPLNSAVKFSESIASGDLRDEIDAKIAKRGDEIGTLGSSLNVMIERLREVVESIGGSSDMLAGGSAELSHSAEQMSQGVEAVSSSAQQLSQGASEQASSAEEVSSSLEEMSSSIRQNADNSLQTESISQKASADAAEGGKAVEGTVDAMKLIASKIGIIEEIARNTNLLALNAAIEAARAGEAGRGFAVVASEVRKLAERSQAAAGEIASISRTSVAIAEKAGTLISAIIPQIKKTAELVQEISASSREQASGTEQINKAVVQLDTVIQQNASFSEELSSTTEELSAQSQSVASMSEEISSQAVALNDAISFFKTGESEARRRAAKPASPKKPPAPTKATRGIVLAKGKAGTRDEGGPAKPDEMDSTFEEY
jgi:methyl-accepting chemotaxis protein